MITKPIASTLTCLTLAFVTVSAPAQERKLAVVIGINAYRANSGLPRLQHALADANGLSSTLRNAGFIVSEMTHEVAKKDGQEEMAPQLAYVRDQIRGVLNFPNLGASDSVLITLHGHGVQYDHVGSDGTRTPKFFFCPADATVLDLKTANDITERNRLLPLEELYADLKACKAATKLLIVDACRNDPTAPGVFRESLASSTLPKLPPPEGGTAAFFSCKPNQRAVEDASLNHGVFSHFLVKGLQGEADLAFGGRPADGVVTFSELSAYVANNTYAHVFEKFKVRQSPELRGDYDLNLPLVKLASTSVGANHLVNLADSIRQQSLTSAFTEKLRGELAAYLESCRLASNDDRALISDARDFVYGRLSERRFLPLLESDRARWGMVIVDFADLQQRMTDVGVDDLITSMADAKNRETLKPLRRVLDVSRHILRDKPDELSFQLQSRTVEHSDPVISRIRKDTPAVGVASLWPSMQQAGSAIQRSFVAEYEIHSVAFSPDGKTLIVVQDTGIAQGTGSSGWPGPERDWNVQLLDCSTACVLKTVIVKASVVDAVSMSEDSIKLAVATRDHKIRVWDLVSGQSPSELTGHADLITSVDFSPIGNTLVSASHDNTVRIWDVESGREIKKLAGHKDDVREAFFSPDGEEIASRSYRELKVWRVRTGDEIFSVSKSPIDNLGFSPDGDSIVVRTTGYPNKDDDTGEFTHGEPRIIAWAIDSNEETMNVGITRSPNIRSLHLFLQESLKFSELTSGRDVSVGLASWKIAPRAQIAAVTKGKTVQLVRQKDIETELSELSWERSVAGARLSPDGKTAVMGTAKRIMMLDSESGLELASATVPKQWRSTGSVRFSADGKFVYAGGGSMDSCIGPQHVDESVVVWDMTNLKKVHFFPTDDGLMSKVHMSPNNNWIAAASDCSKFTLWDRETGRKIWRVTEGVSTISFSPDSQTLAVAGVFGSTIQLRSSKTGKVIRTLNEQGDGNVRKVRFAPDGNTLMAIGYHDLKLWILSRDGGVSAINLSSTHFEGLLAAYATNSRTLLTIDQAKAHSATLWDTSTGRKIRTFKTRAGTSSSQFSPDGSVIATSADDGTLTFWDTNSGRHLKTVTLDLPVRLVDWKPNRLLAVGLDDVPHMFDPDVKKLLQANP